MERRKLVELGIEEGVAVVCLTGERPLNTLNEAMLLELGDVFSEIRGLREVRAVILRAEGRAFAAGADVASLERLSGLEAQRFSEIGQRVFGQIEKLTSRRLPLSKGSPWAVGWSWRWLVTCVLRRKTPSSANQR